MDEKDKRIQELTAKLNKVRDEARLAKEVVCLLCRVKDCDICHFYTEFYEEIN